MDFYRFRPMDKLLGDFRELENQSIFFASPEQLNDPMEGYRDFFWSGDHVVWRNLFRHYLRCLEHAYIMAMVAGEGTELKLSLDDWPLLAGRDDFPTDEYRKRFHEIEARFFGNERINCLLEGIVSVSRPIRRNELLFYLKYAHLVALESIHDINVDRGLAKGVTGGIDEPRPEPPFVDINYFQALSNIPDDDTELDALFHLCSLVDIQLRLLRKVTNELGPTRDNQEFVVIDFPEKYLKGIERLVFPDWYTACFMSDCSNSSVWGNYGHNHSGVCLIFESKEEHGREYLPLSGYNSVSTSGPLRGAMSLQFFPVRYEEGYANIDFFRSIGRLPGAVVMSTWFSDGQGRVSECAQQLQADQDAWRQTYWSNFIGDLSRKTKDWAYELEHRLVLHSSVVDLEDPKLRILNYDFSSLKGIVFGINTPIQDKVEVMRIIEKKCAEKNRSEFAFYQAVYSPKTNCIERVPLTMLKGHRQSRGRLG